MSGIVWNYAISQWFKILTLIVDLKAFLMTMHWFYFSTLSVSAGPLGEVLGGGQQS